MNIKSNKIWIIALCLLVVGIVGAISYCSPYWTVAQLEIALNEKNEEKIKEYIDFNSVKDSLIKDMSQKTLKELKIQPGDENAATVILGVQQMIDDSVNPKKVIEIFNEQKKVKSNFTTKTDYMSIGKFLHVLKNEKTNQVVVLRFIRLNPFQWKLDQVLIIQNDNVEKK